MTGETDAGAESNTPAGAQPEPESSVHRDADFGWLMNLVARVVTWFPAGFRESALRGLAIFSGRRVPGLAAEAAFWVVFSLPWLSLAIVSGLAWISQFFTNDPVDDLHRAVQDLTNQVLTPEAAAQYATPAINDFFSASRPDVGILGLLLAIWAGSRAVLTYVEAIMLVNGEYGAIGYARRRLLAIGIYVVGALMCIAAIPLIVIGPQQLGEHFSLAPWIVTGIFLGLSVLAAFMLIVFLFHFSSMVKHPLRQTWQGAAVAVLSCGVASVFLTIYMRRIFNASSVYGILATPIALMIFAYIMSLMVLVGAVFNAVRTNRAVFESPSDPHRRFARGTRLMDSLTAAPAERPPAEPPSGESVRKAKEAADGP